MNMDKEAEKIATLALGLSILGLMLRVHPDKIVKDAIGDIKAEMLKFRAAVREEVLNEIQETNRALADALNMSADKRREK